MMASWNGTDVVYWPDEPIEEYPSWIWRDCGCCNGISWGGDEPVDCHSCKARGRYAIHIPTGTVAEYPGGPLLGFREKATP